MDFQKLRNELINDPLGRGYASMSDVQAADNLNTKNRQILENLPAKELLLWAADQGRFQKIRADDEKTQNSNALRSAAGAMVVVIRAYQDVDPRDSRWNTLLDFLVTSGTLTQGDKDALVIAATITRSRAEELGLGYITPGDVQAARAL